MLLDSFKLHKVIFQIAYDDAFELWDSAGAISRELSGIWHGLKLHESNPQAQIVYTENVSIQTGFDKSTITLDGESSLDQKTQQSIKETFDVWKDFLNLSQLKRLSTRSIYAKEFDSIADANNELFSLNLAKWPSQKVFDQPQGSELNTFDINYRFEDENSFSFLRFKSEKVSIEARLSPEFDEREFKKTKNRLLVDYDRGLLGKVDVDKLLINEWLKGYNHILRRDIDKIFKD